MPPVRRCDIAVPINEDATGAFRQVINWAQPLATLRVDSVSILCQYTPNEFDLRGAHAHTQRRPDRPPRKGHQPSGQVRPLPERERGAPRGLTPRPAARAEDRAKLKRLRQEIQTGIDQLDRGDYIEFDSISDLRAHFRRTADKVLSKSKKN
jgi:hypothetical protein